MDTTSVDTTSSISINGQKMNVSVELSSLDIIALSYENSDSDVDETESKSHGQSSGEDTDIIQLQTGSDYHTEVSSKSLSETSDDDCEETCISSTSSDTKSITGIDTDESDSDFSKDNGIKSRDENTGKLKASRTEKMKGELDDLPPIEDLKIDVPEVLCESFGQIGWTVEQMVIIRPITGKPTLNLDTVLFLEKGRKVLGQVFDVFGQVSEPHYCVRFNNSKHIQENDIKVGMTVYYCPSTPYTSLVFLHELMKLKGYDELGDDEPPEFSDDEEERAYYEMQKQKQYNEKSDVQNSKTSHKRKHNRVPHTYCQSDNKWNNSSWKQNCNDQGSQFCEHNVHTWSTNQQNAYHPQYIWPSTISSSRKNMKLPPFSFQRPPFASVQHQFMPRPNIQRKHDFCSDHLESVHTSHKSIHNYNPQSCFQQNNVTYKDNMMPSLGHRHIFGAPPRFHSNYEYFAQSQPNTSSSLSIRFPRMDLPWYPYSLPNMNLPWIPPPPPPPPSPPPPYT